MSTPLEGREVALAGRFAAMTQRELADVISELGGTCVAKPTRATALLIVGQEVPPLHPDGRPTYNLEKARQLRAAGYALEIISEEDFITRMELQPRETHVRQYTIGQLSRILNVSVQRLRIWMRAGLIEPIEVVNRLPFFDFRQVSSAKTLCDLIASGVSPARIRDSLQRMRQWLPHIDQPLSQLAVLEDRGRILVRLQSGQLAEPSGQLQLDFGQDEDAASLQMENRSAEEWFEEALLYEEAANYDQAIAAYRRAVELSPDDPVLHFNLGNVLYTQTRLEEAAYYFRRAVESDPTYVEAWNNLGIVLAEGRRLSEATTCLQRALRVMPTYADAHYNLADTLYESGETLEACRHWRAYLQLDPASPWADEVRERLQHVENTIAG